MALSAMKGKPRKKKQPRARAKFGIAGAPIEKGLESTKYYFHTEVDKKALSEQLKTYIKKNYSKGDAKTILACPEYMFYMHTHYSAIAFWLNSNLPEEELKFKNTDWKEALTRYIEELKARGTPLLKEKQEAAAAKGNVIVLTPMQKLQNKIQNTIMDDLFLLEDQWIEGEKTTLDVFNRFKYHGLTGAAIVPVKKVVEGWLLDYEDAYHKRCDQAVEGYSHLSRSELNRRIKCCH